MVILTNDFNTLKTCTAKSWNLARNSDYGINQKKNVYYMDWRMEKKDHQRSIANDIAQ